MSMFSNEMPPAFDEQRRLLPTYDSRGIDPRATDPAVNGLGFQA